MCNFIKKDGNQCGNAADKNFCHIKSHRESVEAQLVIDAEEIIIAADKDAVVVDANEDVVLGHEVVDVDDEINKQLIEAKFYEATNIPSTEAEKKMSPNSAAVVEPPAIAAPNTTLYEEGKTLDSKNINATYSDSDDSGYDTDDKDYDSDYFNGYQSSAKLPKKVQPADIEDSKEFEEFERARQAESYEVEAKATQAAEVAEVNDRLAIDDRQFYLCVILNPEWFQDSTNLWNLAGFFSRIPMANRGVMAKTFITIIQSKSEYVCDRKQCMKTFNQWADPEYKYYPRINLTKLKQIASVHNLEKYNEWKAKYEPAEPPKEKTKAKSNDSDIELTDKCNLRIEKIGQLNSSEKDFLLEGMREVDSMLEEDWLDAYVSVVNRPILGYKRTWQQYIWYVQAIKFQLKQKAAALLAMTIDHYVILMGTSFLYRCGLDSDYSNDVLTQSPMNSLDEITMTYFCEEKADYKSIKALKIYEQHKSLFYTYEEYTNQWGDVHPTKFSTYIPFKGDQLDSVDEDVIEPFLTFVKEIIANEQWRRAVYVVDQMDRPHLHVSKLSNLMRLDSVVHGGRHR